MEAFEELLLSAHLHLLTSSLSLDHIHHDVDRTTALGGLP